MIRGQNNIETMTSYFPSPGTINNASTDQIKSLSEQNIVW